MWFIARSRALLKVGLLGLPTETAYGVAASALQVEAVARLKTLCPQGWKQTLALFLRGPAELADWVPDASPLATRIASRVWPGPVTLILSGGVERGLASRLAPSVRALVAPGETIALRSCQHPIVREVQRLLPGPIVIDKLQREAVATSLFSTTRK